MTKEKGAEMTTNEARTTLLTDPVAQQLLQATPLARLAEAHRSSTGHNFASSGWLEAHYQTCQPEYEAMLRAGQ
jgi:hypothetical protein